MGFNYMAFPMLQSLHDGRYQPTVGDVARVSTFVGNGIFAQIVGEERAGYSLKHPSADGVRELRKIVPHWVGFERVDKTLPQIAAQMFWANGLRETDRGLEFSRWRELPTFIASWGELGLCELLLIAHRTTGAERDFESCVQELRDTSLIAWLTRDAKFQAVREAAALVLEERTH